MASLLPWRGLSVVDPAHPCSRAVGGDCCEYLGQILLNSFGTAILVIIIINALFLVYSKLRFTAVSCKHMMLQKKLKAFPALVSFGVGGAGGDPTPTPPSPLHRFHPPLAALGGGLSGGGVTPSRSPSPPTSRRPTPRGPSPPTSRHPTPRGPSPPGSRRPTPRGEEEPPRRGPHPLPPRSLPLPLPTPPSTPRTSLSTTHTSSGLGPHPPRPEGETDPPSSPSPSSSCPHPPLPLGYHSPSPLSSSSSRPLLPPSPSCPPSEGYEEGLGEGDSPPPSLAPSRPHPPPPPPPPYPEGTSPRRPPCSLTPSPSGHDDTSPLRDGRLGEGFRRGPHARRHLRPQSRELAGGCGSPRGPSATPSPAHGRPRGPVVRYSGRGEAGGVSPCYRDTPLDHGVKARIREYGQR